MVIIFFSLQEWRLYLSSLSSLEWHFPMKLMKTMETIQILILINLTQTKWGKLMIDSTVANIVSGTLSYYFLSSGFTLQKKWSFPLMISSVNVTKSEGNCVFSAVSIVNLARPFSWLEMFNIYIIIARSSHRRYFI